MENFLIYNLNNFDHLTSAELYDRHPVLQDPVTRNDGGPPEPHAPPQAVVPMMIDTPEDEPVDPVVKISDCGNAFVVTTNNRSPSKLRTRGLYMPPEGIFDEPGHPAADIWSLGASLYEVLGDQVLFGYNSDPDSVLAHMVCTLGPLPQRWLDKWAERSRGDFFNGDYYDSEKEKHWRWCRGSNSTPIFLRLHQRMREDIGRGVTAETCQRDHEGAEMRALEEMLMGMLTYEPDKRLTAEEVMKSEYMVNWALPAWERQMKRQGSRATK